MDPVIEDTAAAGEHMEIEETSAEVEHTEIEATSAASAEYREKEGTLDAKHNRSIKATMHRLIKETKNALSMERQERNHWPKNSIFRVPAHIRSSRESNFEPKLVSIGPYYHGRENLKCMEDLKIRCIKEILKMMTISVTRTEVHSQLRMSSYTEPVELDINGLFVPKFMASGWEARSYYKEGFDHSPEIFVKMLFLDSCFIIRTMLALSQPVQESISFLDVHIKEVRSDLLLLDNQIPLFFIKKVYEFFLTSLKDEKIPSFDTILEPFICLDMPWIINHHAMMSSEDAVHLLELYWRCSLPPQMDLELTGGKNHFEQIEIDRSYNALTVIANATDLQQKAGIEFEKFKDKGHLDVTFSKGVMRIPGLKIDNRQLALLHNLIVFENCVIPRMRIISYYMKLMDALINSEKDVELLQNSSVIYNTLSNHEKAATFFNDIGDFCFTDDNANPFSDLYRDVQKYYDSRWNRRMASLRHNYFSSPWTGISVVAAVILLILSVVQTFYAIYGYHKPIN